MQLTLGLGGVVNGPTETQVEKAIRSLPGGDDSFAILAQTRRDDRSKEYYIQTLGGAGEGYLLEYREGNAQRHFRCTTEGLSTEAVLAAFLDYLHARAGYKADLQWEQKAPEDTSRLLELVVVVVLVVLVGLVAYWLLW